MHKYTLEDQLKLEQEYKEYAKELFISRHREQENKGRGAATAVGKGLTNHYADLLAENIKQWLEDELKPRRGVQKEYKKLLEALVKAVGQDKVLLNACAFTFETVINAVVDTRGRQSVSSVASTIGVKLYHECKLEAYLQTVEDRPKVKRIEAEVSSRVQTRYKWNYVDQITIQDNYDFYKAEPRELLAIGAALLHMFKEVTGIVDFLTTTKNIFLVPNDKFMQIWAANLDNIASRLTLAVPTIIPPKPWTGLFEGAYYGALKGRTQLLRLTYMQRKTRTVQNYIRRVQELDLTEVMEAINKIQETAYRINTPVLDLVHTLIQLGGDRAGVERMQPYDKLPYLTNGTDEQVKVHKKKAVELIHKEAARKSKAIRVMKTVAFAKDFSKYETIYFPCNMDFRGRIYPLSYFSHQGDDLMKSLLVYADPVPCKDPSDFELLQIQGCNLWGNDKVSLLERIIWVEENSHHILASAKDPLGYTWWEQADEPLQFIAFCMEYAKAKEYIEENGSIVGYKCGIVICYDGTCSGLQHYSAMLQDPIGGSAVNLIDHEKPADIYQEVADKVQALVESDLDNGSVDTIVEDKDGREFTKYGTKTLATAWLAHGINRKVCKRPVMTLAYGSGQYGFGEQILEDTVKDSPEFDGMRGQAARYLAAHIWTAVQKVVVAATEGMNFLKALAKELSKEDLPVNWYTPLGLPVQQPYLEFERKEYRARFGAKIRMRLYYNEVTDMESVDRNHQRNGIAPNFIHSLDSTHLMMTVNAAGLANYTTIHDSFGTSLGEARHLKQVIREQLYILYTEYRPLEAFKDYVEEQLGRPVDVELPQKGTLDLKEILTSTFVFH